MIDAQNDFNQPVKIMVEHMEIWKQLQMAKEVIMQLVVCFIIRISEKSKQQALDADQKIAQQNCFTGSLDGVGSTIFFFILAEIKETALDITKGT